MDEQRDPYNYKPGFFAGAEHDGNLSDLLDRCSHYFAHRLRGSHRGQSKVLALLAYNPEATQKQLAEDLGVTPASLSEVLIKLEHKGLIEREKDENDHRFIRVRLTEMGEQALKEPDDTMHDPFQSLSQEDQAALARLLSKLLADWSVRYPPERNRRGGRRYDEHSAHGDSRGCRGDEHPEHGNKRPEHSRNNMPCDDNWDSGARGHRRR